MIGILIALKSILEIDVVAGALGALDAGLNIAGFFSIMKSKLPKDSIEAKIQAQMISTLDESLRESCKKLGWYYDSMAAYMWLDAKKILSSTVMTRESLDYTLEILTGKQINETASNVFVNCFDMSVAGKPELYRYLIQQGQRYIAEISGPPAPIFVPPVTDFSNYYKLVVKQFIRQKSVENDENVNLVGAYSDKDAYIDAYIKVNNKKIPVLSYLEQWFLKDTFGTLLLYGEPGHGKSTLCKKAMVEFCGGEFLKNKAKNVLLVSLNTGDNRELIKDGKVNLEGSLVWGGEKHPFTFKDCHGSLLFMDGFDEFIDEANTAGIKNIVSFMNRIQVIADENNIHIVVLSRTTAVNDFLSSEKLQGKSYALLPISHKQQDDWLDRHVEYDSYKGTFSALRHKKVMGDLLGIPFLFRLIVHSRFDETTSNIAELYGRLLNHLLQKRYFDKAEKDAIISELCNLSYDIYCNDTNTAVIEGDKRNTQWMKEFYLKQYENGEVGFYHRSFYQYFLAKYIYSGILNLEYDNAANFIGKFAERELDITVRNFLSLIYKIDSHIIYSKLDMLIDCLVETEAYINLDLTRNSKSAEKKKLSRTVNVFRNILHICASLSYVIQKPFKETIDKFLRLYPSHNITIYSNEKKQANLIEVDLVGADLGQADLRKANLSKADLRRTNFSGANLIGTILSSAKMIDSDLRSAYLINANLKDTVLERADMRRANLTGANMINVNLNRALLNEANLSGVKLIGAHMDYSNLTLINLKGVDLRGANLNRAKLKRAFLSRTDLSGAIFNGADLSRADLSGAKLMGAHLSGSELRKAILRETDLRGADLRRANLEDADLYGADLRGANLEGAYLRVKNLSFAIIDKKSKGYISPSIKGFNSILWL